MNTREFEGASQPAAGGKEGRARHAGFSLVTVAALGSVVMLWMFAITQSVTPMYQRAAQMRYATVVRSAAEAAIDYVISDLVANGATSDFEDEEEGEPYKVRKLASDLVNSPGMDVEVTVKNEVPPQQSYLYDSLLDPHAAGNAVGGKNYFRYVVAKAEYAGFTRYIVAVLKPTHTVPQPTTTTTSTTIAVPYFSYAMFGRSLLSMGGNARSDSYDSRLGAYGPGNVDYVHGSVGGNTSGSLSGNAFVGGDLTIYSPPDSPDAVVATISGNAIVNDQLILNGVHDGNFSSGSESGSANVLNASADPADPIQVQSGIEQPLLPPAPSAPQSSPDYPVYTVGDVAISGNANIVIRQGAAAPSGSLSVSGNRTVYIPPGDYVVNSLRTAGNGTIRIESSVTTPTRFFIQGSTSGGNAVQVTGNGIVNQTNTPGMLQMFYDGSQGVNLAGNGNLTAVVYAPNADLNLAGNGSLFGAVVANNISNAGNGTVHFDRALSEASGTWGLNYMTSTSTTTSAVSVQITGIKTVSWLEL